MNYDEMISAAIAYADRQDIEVNANIDTFVIMAEARVNRLLKTRQQSHRIFTPTVAGSYYPLPPDYAGMRDAQLYTTSDGDSPTLQLSYLAPEQMNNTSNRQVSKNYYTIIANQIQIYPETQVGGNIELVYYRKVQRLTSAAPNNWLSDDHPDIYLAGIIAEIETFVKNYEVATAWDAKMSRSIKELDNSDVVERWAGSSLTTRVE